MRKDTRVLPFTRAHTCHTTCCPICHAAVFSPSGVHPQCVARRFIADKKASKKAALLAALPGGDMFCKTSFLQARARP